MIAVDVVVTVVAVVATVVDAAATVVDVGNLLPYAKALLLNAGLH
jgi:hypothetical protein